MEKEKVKYVKLPAGAKYRRVEVTEDGRIGIVYTGVLIPKPKALIGGTKVYQKNNGIPYWYCKIKEGRDEFMHLYFEDLTENDLLYDTNGKKRKFVSEREIYFKEHVLTSLKCKPEEGYRWIPVFEPSKDKETGNVQFIPGEKVLVNVTSKKYEEMFKEYSSHNGSQMATITTYFLLALRWLKDGIVTIEQLTDDSKEIGHYCDSKDAKKHFEKTGEREFGGLYGFVGNTGKIVKDFGSFSKFSSVGGHYEYLGIFTPFAKVCTGNGVYSKNLYNLGLLELTK